jgi:hypothetical protein
MTNTVRQIVYDALGAINSGWECPNADPCQPCYNIADELIAALETAGYKIVAARKAGWTLEFLAGYVAGLQWAGASMYDRLTETWKEPPHAQRDIYARAQELDPK